MGDQSRIWRRATITGGRIRAPRLQDTSCWRSVMTTRKKGSRLLRKRERNDVWTRGDRNVLFTVEYEGHRRSSPEWVRRKAPEWLPVCRVGCHELICVVAEEKQACRGG